MKNTTESIIAVIPARSGSKGIPDKNIRPLDGAPLLAYSIAVSKLSKKIERVIVSTDSKHYASIAQKFGAEVPFLRPKEISGDNNTDYECFKHLLNWLEQSEGSYPEYLVHLRPTTPLREVYVIDQAIEYMIKHPDATALRSMHKTHLTPYKMFKLNGGYAAPFLKYKNIKEFYNLSRQEFEDAYIPNGHVDIVRPEIILKTRFLHGNRMKIWETDLIPDIDVLEDFEYASRILHEDRFKKIRDYVEEKL